MDLTKINMFAQGEIVSSWDVLTRVHELFLEEYKRVNMSTELDDVSYGYRDTNRFPECGAVGCIGGWSGVLIGVARVDPENPHRTFDLQDVAEALGLDWIKEAQALFFPSGWSDTSGLGIFGRPGTREYALKVVKHLDSFMDTYEEKLKRHKITIQWPQPNDRQE